MVIVYELDGVLRVITPSEEWLETKTLEQLAEKDVPEGVNWHIVDASAIPSSRNWRNAWVSTDGSIAVDLEKAKAEHRVLILSVSRSRVPTNSLGLSDYSKLVQEINELPIDEATSLEELYNMWPESTNMRTSYRTYKSHQ